MINRPLFLTLLSLLLVACGSEKEGSKSSSTTNKPSSRPQVVATSQTRVESVPVILQVQGYITAQDEVDIRPEKTGMVRTVHIKEGAEVRKGQLLFSLDSRDDEANVKKAESSLLSSKAQWSTDQRALERNKDLAAKGFISPTALEQLQNKVDTGVAAVGQAEATLTSARVQLSYDHVTAPFSGRVGSINVRAGSMVSTNATTPMVRITRINPITVNFPLPENKLSALRAAIASNTAKVQVDTSSNKMAQGKVVFIENNIDRTSGTIAVKAEIENSEYLLWPGQYVPVRVLAGMIKDAVTLPAQAILNSPNGRFVYVINPDQTVKSQPVEIVQIYQERAVVTGIPGGVKVVLEGGQNLRPGGKVIEVSAPGKSDHSRTASAKATATNSSVAPSSGITPRAPDAGQK